MPENAAAEGGFGLGTGEAFGGQVGTGNVSASAVGGAFGGGTAADFGGRDSNPAAQAAAAQNAISVASGLFSNNAVQAGLLGLAAQLSGTNANPSLGAPAVSPGFNPEAAFGLGTPGLNASTGGFLGTTASPDTAPAADPSGYAMADVTGVSGMTRGLGGSNMSPADVASPSTQDAVDAAMSRGGLQSGNFGPGLLGGTVSSADLASGNTQSVSTGRGGSVTSTPGSLESMSFGVPEGMLSASTSTPSQMSTNMANDMAALAAAQAIAQSQQDTTPAISAPATNVSPAQIAQDVSLSTTAPATTTSPSRGIFGRNPNAPAYADRGLLGKLGMDLAMGLSINPFASREDQAQSLADRGYSQADIDGYFGRTDANIAATNAAVENAVGTRDYISDAQLKQYAQSLPAKKKNEFDRISRQQQLQQYYRAMGY